MDNELRCRRLAEAGELDRIAVADGLAGGADFAVAKLPLLSALGHGNQLTVVRNPNIVLDTDEIYQPVAKYIDENGLNLAERREFHGKDGFHYEASWWMNRLLMRDGLLNYGPSPLEELERELTR
jgi:hypothetical protein